MKAHYSEELNLIYFEANRYLHDDSDIQNLEGECSNINFNQEIILPMDATDAGFEISIIYRLINEIKTIGKIIIDTKYYFLVVYSVLKNCDKIDIALR